MLNEIVLKYKDRVFNTAYRFIGDWQDANELTQETFITVYGSVGNFKNESALSAEIYRIAIKLCKNRLSSFETSSRQVGFGQKKTQGTITRGVPHKLLEKKEKEMAVQKALDSLPFDRKEVLILKDIEGLSYQEVAAVLLCELGAVKSSLKRARNELRIRLDGAQNG
ncbi:MAG: sigma-70 family RNA polymerase sigma factor [Candidatus Firestonebacteria bacterium]